MVRAHLTPPSIPTLVGANKLAVCGGLICLPANLPWNTGFRHFFCRNTQAGERMVFPRARSAENCTSESRKLHDLQRLPCNRVVMHPPFRETKNASSNAGAFSVTNVRKNTPSVKRHAEYLCRGDQLYRPAARGRARFPADCKGVRIIVFARGFLVR